MCKPWSVGQMKLSGVYCWPIMVNNMSYYPFLLSRGIENVLESQLKMR